MAKLGDSGVLVAFVLSVLVHIRCQVSVRMHTASTSTAVAATVDLLQLADLCWAACQGSWACKNYCLYNDCGKYSDWLAKNVDRGRCKALQVAPIRQEISRLKDLIMEETGVVDLRWQCQWTLRSYHAALKGLLRICRQHSSAIDLAGN